MAQGIEHKPNEESRLIARELFACGIPKARIAARLGITKDCFAKHYAEECRQGKDDIINRLSKSMTQRALDGDQKAAEFWLCCQARWSKYKPVEKDVSKATAGTLIESLIDRLNP